MTLNSPKAWPQGGAVVISNDDVLKMPGNGILRIYDPFTRPNLPNRFAKVKDADSAVKFISTYGLLGYSDLNPPEKRLGGDPLGWVLDHAESVRFALQLIAARTESDKKRLDYLLTQHVIQGLNVNSYTIAAGSMRKSFTLLTTGSSFEHAAALIKEMVNSNIQNVRWELLNDAGRLMGRLTFKSLIEVIWRLVGDMAILNGEGKTIGYCNECHLPFIKTDKRQIFCPPDEFSQKSLCGAKYRMKKRRERKEANE